MLIGCPGMDIHAAMKRDRCVGPSVRRLVSDYLGSKRIAPNELGTPRLSDMKVNSEVCMEVLWDSHVSRDKALCQSHIRLKV